MKINIGSKNPAKVSALKEILINYPYFKEAEVCSVDAVSGVDNQPKSLEETITGAKNRAKDAFHDCDYSFGLESGLMTVPQTATGYMDVCACAIFDGKEYYFGLSSAWEPPKKVVEYMIQEGMDMNEAAYKAGLTNNSKIGSAEGLIGIMSKGRLTRQEYTKEAIRTALIRLEEEGIY
ncbi:MAG: inosine/xanthosine triphosphatase [bacterium]|nr:inosine/xanthosine triphosphatase [bacterium]